MSRLRDRAPADPVVKSVIRKTLESDPDQWVSAWDMNSRVRAALRLTHKWPDKFQRHIGDAVSELVTEGCPIVVRPRGRSPGYVWITTGEERDKEVVRCLRMMLHYARRISTYDAPVSRLLGSGIREILDKRYLADFPDEVPEAE